ncbi:MAG: glycosyltransferase family 2 protein [Anaerolineales bacterium]
MENSPLVSIGMPVYNGEKHLPRALASLLNQSYINFEILISDNASADGTEEICKKFARQDKRIHYFRNQENIGAWANFQRVLELARGEYFMWAACDDCWMPDFLSALITELETNREAVVAMSAVQRVWDDGETIDTVRFHGSADPRTMSAFKLAMALASGRPYHLYIYGVYRTSFIKHASRYLLKDVVGADRLFICLISLVKPFGYVDQVLHVRQVNRTPIQERYKYESLGHVWRDRFGKEKMVWVAGSYLWKSPLIPRERKIYIPFVLARLALHVGVSRLRRTLYGVQGLLKVN